MLASLFPSLPFLALTATATKQTKNIIVESLGLVEPVFFEINPDRSNIFFASKRRPNKGNDKLCPILIPLIEELKEKRQNSPLTVVYGNLETVSECFMFASKTMGPLQYEPLGSDPLAKNRMFTQFHAQYPDHEWERIIKELTNGSSKLRLLFVTVAFGIGIDVDNIRRVIHIGVPRTVEEFFQEAGRCGRDGLDATSLVYFNSYDIASSRNVSQPMIDFVTSIRCKREIILSHFGHKVPERSVPDHLCCDFHQQTCECDDCVLLSVSHLFLVECNPEGNDHNISTLRDDSAVHSPSLRKKSKLRKLLLDYRQLLHGSGRSCVGSISLSTGFSLELVDLVVEHAPELTTIEEVKSKLPIFSNDHADFIFNVVRSILSEDERF